ncbi:hypothetical protein [Alkalicoccobacillus murimartini]|uniref:DUF2892 domain-containing protein n=1 Tax=Alkalicoccobacillus murimartini TaxID=171685 RepID=A0ABT9YJ53_9BACI|nr:hypothetical protein [Alkalicoccobacillus murimartini]MDQ0207888.1 hypothetical protein [Alkalicoccobacillus murimartini]
MKVLAWAGRISLILAAFVLYMLGLMKVIPVLIGGLFLFASILFALYPAKKTNRFKGFRP